ncbi:MAG: sodium pump decarboxylase gamma subunit [Clostridia bacterium]|nr:sodium pump decarboxylase gamma subunit [Clostridia bacterium]
MNINFENLQIAFELMGMGMLGIFIVMAAISLIVYLFTKFSR